LLPRSVPNFATGCPDRRSDQTHCRIWCLAETSCPQFASQTSAGVLLAGCAGREPYRGFESLPLRHATVLLRIRLFEPTAKPTSTLLPPVLRCYPQSSAQTVVFDRGFGGRIFRHCTVLLCIPLFEATAKTTSSAIKAVAASSAMLPLVTAQKVSFRHGFGGRILRGRTHG
jgi:hypothetical protein